MMHVSKTNILVTLCKLSKNTIQNKTQAPKNVFRIQETKCIYIKDSRRQVKDTQKNIINASSK